MPAAAPPKGFSLIELMIGVAITAILAVVGLLYLFSAARLSDLRNVTRELSASLSEAETQSVDDTQGSTWGVHIANPTSTAPFYAMFMGSSYGSGTVQDYHRLPATVAFVTSTLGSGSSTDIVFTLVSGAASQSTTVKMYLLARPTWIGVVSVASSGMVNFTTP